MAARKPKLAARVARVEGFSWSLEKLADEATYYDEAKRGRAAGIEGVGRFGVSCPRCYLMVPVSRKGKMPAGFKICQCADQECDQAEVAAALGFGAFKYGSTSKVQVV
jgi:nitrate/nitrite transporter NarK